MTIQTVVVKRYCGSGVEVRVRPLEMCLMWGEPGQPPESPAPKGQLLWSPDQGHRGHRSHDQAPAALSSSSSCKQASSLPSLVCLGFGVLVTRKVESVVHLVIRLVGFVVHLVICLVGFVVHLVIRLVGFVVILVTKQTAGTDRTCGR